MTSGVPVSLSTSGVLPAGLSTGITYYASITGPTTLRLAANVQNAIAGTPVVPFSNNGTPPNFLIFPAYVPGEFTGEELHTLTIPEMPSHNHPGSTVTLGNTNTAAGGQPNYSGAAPADLPLVKVASQGGGQPHNTLQPTTYMNVFLKL
jgi:hypothetical protein